MAKDTRIIHALPSEQVEGIDSYQLEPQPMKREGPFTNYLPSTRLVIDKRQTSPEFAARALALGTVQRAWRPSHSALGPHGA